VYIGLSELLSLGRAAEKARRREFVGRGVARGYGGVVGRRGGAGRGGEEIKRARGMRSRAFAASVEGKKKEKKKPGCVIQKSFTGWLDGRVFAASTRRRGQKYRTE
jgi:hypothetical protein